MRRGMRMGSWAVSCSKSTLSLSRSLSTGRNFTCLLRNLPARRNFTGVGYHVAGALSTSQGRWKHSRPLTRVAIDRVGFSSVTRASEVTTTTKLSFSDGHIIINLPLPRVPGLTAISVPVNAPLRDFAKEIMSQDKSLTSVDVDNADGNKVAASTAMADIDGSRGMVISLGGRPWIRVLGDGSEDHPAQDIPAPDVYDLIKAEVVEAGRITLTRDRLDALCAKVYQRAKPQEAEKTLDPLLADGWLNALVDDGLAFTADKGRVILINPSGPGVSGEIASALRKDDELIGQKVARLRQKLEGMYREDRRLQAIEDRVVSKAHRNVTIKKSAVLAFMTLQFGTLAYFVYEVYSWDVMEPATYFLMLSYTVGSSLYYSAKQREASFENLRDVALRKREAELKPLYGYSRSGHEALKADIKRYEEAVKLLISHRDAHPPQEPYSSDFKRS